MACDLTTGIALDCKNKQGGLSSIYLLKYIEDAFTISATNEATAINPLVTVVYEYQIEGDGHILAQSFPSDRNTGSAVNTQTLTALIKGVAPTVSAELNNLVYGKTIAVAKDRNGIYRIMGISDGVDFSIEMTTGGAKTDMNGYTLTGTALEKALAPSMDSATLTAFLALVA